MQGDSHFSCGVVLHANTRKPINAPRPRLINIYGEIIVHFAAAMSWNRAAALYDSDEASAVVNFVLERMPIEFDFFQEACSRSCKLGHGGWPE